MSDQPLHIVAVTTDPTLRQCLELLSEGGHRVDAVPALPDLLSRLTPNTALLIVDESAAGPSEYIAVIRRARREAPGVDAVVAGGPKSDDVLRQEREEGVDVYLDRPFDEASVALRLEHRLDLAGLKRAAGIVGRSAGLEEILEAVLQVAPTEVPILIEGESGTGKDVIARAIHRASRRADKPLESVNCGSLAEGVLESELFGHEKGAFTGAVSRRAGLFERADAGTVFLDEVGEMSPSMQVRLLRALESGEVIRVGGTSAFHVDVRVIAATNRNLAESVAEGTFRQDLYYRVKGVNLRIPPLRERREDVPLLVTHFIAAANRRHKKSVRGIDAAAMRRLRAYAWPGNVRELRNVVDTLVVLAPGRRIDSDLVDAQLREDEASHPDSRGNLLPVALNRSRDEAEREMIYASILALHRDVREILAVVRRDGSPVPAGPFGGLREVRAEPTDLDPPDLSLKQLERATVQEALKRARGNRREAAAALGISERTLYRKIKEFGLV